MLFAVVARTHTVLANFDKQPIIIINDMSSSSSSRSCLKISIVTYADDLLAGISLRSVICFQSFIRSRKSLPLFMHRKSRKRNRTASIVSASFFYLLYSSMFAFFAVWATYCCNRFERTITYLYSSAHRRGLSILSWNDSFFTFFYMFSDPRVVRKTSRVPNFLHHFQSTWLPYCLQNVTLSIDRPSGNWSR